MPIADNRLRLRAVLPLALAFAPLPTARERVNVGADFADPFVLRAENVYFAFATNAGGDNVQAARSFDLATWTRLPDALPALPPWAAKGEGLTWAPSVLRRGDRYVMYYTARDVKSGFQCISRAVSARPEGPYTDESTRPFVCQVDGAERLCGSIDPSPFVDENGQAYLLWKSDENAAACGRAPRIWAQPLKDDGLDVTGAPTPLLAMDRAWERPIIEGPSMVRARGKDYLFYSANDWETAHYGVGYAVCDGPLGPCAKVTTAGPWLASDGPRLGPGGQEAFTDSAGNARMAFHAWTAPHTSYAEGGARSLRIARLVFDGDVPALR